MKLATMLFVACLLVLPTAAQAQFGVGFTQGYYDSQNRIKEQKFREAELELRRQELEILRQSLNRSQPAYQPQSYQQPSMPQVQQTWVTDRWCAVPGRPFWALPQGGVQVQNYDGSVLYYPVAQMFNGVLYVWARC